MAQARPKNPYKVVPIPAGYRRALPKEITPKVQRAAVRALQQALPIGKLQATEVDGKIFAFITEGHYDDHVTKPGKPIWHPGISTVVPINQPKPVKVASQSVRDAQFINMSRMTGENDSTFGGFWSSFKRWLTEPAAPSKPRPPQTAAQKQQDAAAAAMVLSQMRGDGFGAWKKPNPNRNRAERMAFLAQRRAQNKARMGEEEIDDPNFRADVGTEENLESVYAADELYDAVNGEDFEMGDVGTDFGDDFGKFNLKRSLKKAVSKKGLKKFAKGSLAISTGGLSLAASKKGRKIVKKVAKKAVSRKGLAAIATGGASLALAKKNRALTGAVLTGGLSLAARSQRKAVARRVAPKKAAPRPVARAVARTTAARPVTRPTAARPTAVRPTAPRTTPTKTDSPLGPSAPFDDTMAVGPIEQEMPEQEAFEQEAVEEEAYEEGPSEEVEAALDSYEEDEGGEETPETADEGSDTYDETAINGEGYTHSKYSIGA
ncbi:MAG: hypothetical protein WC554_18115 [Clostridia bacterium]